MALIGDGIHVLAWQKTKDGQKGLNRPTPIQRPGSRDDSERVGSGALSLEEMEAWLGWNAGNAAAIDDAMTELDGGDTNGR